MLKSVRFKLFVTISLAIIFIIIFFVVVNSAVIEKYYYYKKYKNSLEAFKTINSKYNGQMTEELSEDIKKMCLEKGYDIIINNQDENIFESNNNYLNDFDDLNIIKSKIKYSIFNKEKVLYSDGKANIRIIQDNKYDLKYMVLYGELDSGDIICIRNSISVIDEMAEVSNRLLGVVAAITIILGGIVIFIVTDKFTKPIEKLNKIAKNISKLDFSEKYELLGTDDEIDNLGKSVNELSTELETTIKKMKKNNMDLERDIEKKSKIDEMRKHFISDVSHELKTPISLIQGYAEGLIENVNSDEESKNFYSEVILDEANKMDKLVKRLLELMKLEYDEREFNNQNFNIVELINEVIRTSKVKLDENDIDVIFNEKEPVYVFADDFYVEQVLTNYFTNAIKNVKEVNDKKQIKIFVKKSTSQGKVRITVFNTGDKIAEENLERIWNRFYKVDEARSREKGGTGIGLALVKAIMTKYGNDYGVNNVKNGVEFYFELNYSVISGEM